MKKNLFYSLLFIMLVSFVFTACNNQRTDKMNDTSMNGTINVGDDANDVTFWDNNKDYSYNDRDQYRLALNDALDKLDARITYLQDKADNASGETKDNINRKIDDLKEQRSKISDKTNDWDKITEAKWENFKSDIAETWDNITDDYNKFVRNMGDNNTKDGNY